MPRFLQMARLRVEFAHIEHGWVQIRFWVEENEYEMQFSYVYREVFTHLCAALLALLDEKGERVVFWMEEPEEYEMRFSKTSEIIELQMWRFDSHRRGLGEKPCLRFEIAGDYAEICVPFWRALKTLRSLYSRDEEFEARWRAPFPDREFALLTEALRARRLT